MKKTAFLAAFFVFLAAGVFFLESTRTLSRKEGAPQMLEATQRTRAAFEAVRKERLARGIQMDAADDPNGTGMIGPPYSGITTTLGALDAKRSATNPNVAAMLVDMLLSLGIGKGDRVAVNLSGSFPTLNIALLCALDTLEIEAVSIFSFGASTYGANMPSLTYGDMERLLYEEGLIAQQSIAFSVGGEGDMGLEMNAEERDAIVRRLGGYGYALLSIPDIDENIDARFAMYHARGPVAAFFNVGGNSLSFGPSAYMHLVHSGIVEELPREAEGHGLAQLFFAEGVPVIQLLNMKSLLPAYGLPVDPVPLPADGEGGVYFEYRYQTWAAFVLLGAALLAAGWARVKRAIRCPPQ